MEMSGSMSCDVVIIGGGLVGLATARALSHRCGVLVLEAEAEVGRHQSGHNSGVIHAGLYYRPGSLKARHCVRGREALERYCAERQIPFERCGKLIVAVDRDEIPALEELARRGAANGLSGLERLDATEIREREPHATGVAGLWVPQTGIVNYGAVSQALAADIERQGGAIRTGFRVKRARRENGMWVLSRADGELVRGRFVVNCAGLHSDRVARLCGARVALRIVPFRGEYYALKENCRHLVRNLIYPVPDPRFPFLGVHFTRRIDGTVEAGPNAVLAGKREGYRRRDVALRDLLELLSYGGFWRLAARYWRTGLAEMARSLSERRFVATLRKLVPELSVDDVEAAGSGVRAQAVTPDGRLLDDFHLLEQDGTLHVLNAPSPAATACLEIGRTIAERVGERGRAG